jgi:hypothetical protein
MLSSKLFSDSRVGVDETHHTENMLSKWWTFIKHAKRHFMLVLEREQYSFELNIVKYTKTKFIIYLSVFGADI